ncbi:hypothetical protein L1887_43618 [Cichorium endivia]|nr:hypothetical protein L1887_43618 [Cichorium endivia]
MKLCKSCSDDNPYQRFRFCSPCESVWDEKTQNSILKSLNVDFSSKLLEKKVSKRKVLMIVKREFAAVMIYKLESEVSVEDETQVAARIWIDVVGRYLCRNETVAV